MKPAAEMQTRGGTHRLWAIMRDAGKTHLLVMFPFWKNYRESRC